MKGASLRRSTRTKVYQNVCKSDTLEHCLTPWGLTHDFCKDSRVPEWIAPHIHQVSDPLGDGHCGYRSIAISLGLSEDDWGSVREDMIMELQGNASFYKSHFKQRGRDDGGVDTHIACLKTSKKNVLKFPSLWLNGCQMMYIITSTYRRVFCVYSPENTSYTALPLNSPPNSNPPIFLAYHASGKHYLSLSMVSLPPIVPMPPVWIEWHELAIQDAKGWLKIFDPHFSLFKISILPKLVEQYPWLYLGATIVLESDSD